MFDKKQLVIVIIGGIILLLLGSVLGVVMTQKPQQVKVNAVNSLSSRVISSIIAYGEVKKVDGKTITLTNLGDEMKILIADNAQVYSFSIPATTDKNKSASPVQQIVKIENIKIGDKVNVTMRLSSTGKMQGSSVVILPPSK